MGTIKEGSKENRGPCRSVRSVLNHVKYSEAVRCESNNLPIDWQKAPNVVL